MSSSTHPTKKLLVETAVSLIDEFGPQGFTVDVLLDTSKISKGSLYHHFENFDDVIEQAQVARFARSVDLDIQQLIALLMSVTSRDELFQHLSVIVASSSSDERRAGRMNRAQIIGLASRSEKYAAALADEQQRLTDAFTDLIREMQERGWVKPEIDPGAGGLFLQAYSLGFVLNDISREPVSGEAWQQFVLAMIRASFMTTEN